MELGLHDCAKGLKYKCGYSRSTVGPVRMERLPKDWFDYNTAFQAVTEFYSCAGSQSDPNVSKMAEGDTAYLVGFEFF